MKTKGNDRILIIIGQLKRGIEIDLARPSSGNISHPQSHQFFLHKILELFHMYYNSTQLMEVRVSPRLLRSCTLRESLKCRVRECFCLIGVVSRCDNFLHVSRNYPQLSELSAAFS